VHLGPPRLLSSSPAPPWKLGQLPKGRTVSLTTYLLAAIASLPTFHEDVGEHMAAQKQEQAQMIAAAIDEAVQNSKDWPDSKRELASLMLATAWHETRLSIRIHDGRCKPLECDRGRARGLWQLQMHRSLPRERWLRVAGLSLEATRDAAREAAIALVRSRRMCAVATRGREWVGPTLTAYAGRGCGGRLPDINARIRTYRRLLSLAQRSSA
jgi:hypothetical protein